MVTINTRVLRHRLGMLQIIGLPLIRYAIKHTLVVMWLLRLSGIVEKGIVKSGKLPMELKAFFVGRVGDYKIRVWTMPVYGDCSRWSLCVARVAV